MTKKTLSDVNLNDAFGLATIMGAQDGIQDALNERFLKTDWELAWFLAYFFVFRVKMYLDDAGHTFEASKPGDVRLALLSWFAFMVSAAASGKSVELAVEWFIAGLLVSIGWVLYSILRYRRAGVRYWCFLLFNFLHVGVLFLYGSVPAWLLFGVLIVFVLLDRRIIDTFDRGPDETGGVTLDR